MHIGDYSGPLLENVIFLYVHDCKGWLVAGSVRGDASGSIVLADVQLHHTNPCLHKKTAFE